jgi:hypothetical protein
VSEWRVKKKVVSEKRKKEKSVCEWGEKREKKEKKKCVKKKGEKG